MIEKSGTRKPVRVLVVGQTPPPFGGQAIMIRRILDHEYEGVELHHVRMAFSQEISDAGKFQIGKIAHLLSVIVRVVWARLRHRTPVLYYPPAGPNRIPVMRDIAILLSTRWMFRRTIFHFHATDLPAVLPALPGLFRLLFKVAYYAPDLVIATSEYNLGDANALHARRHVVIPNSLGEDSFERVIHRPAAGGPCRLLFVGLLTPTKGVDDILSACAILRKNGHETQLVLVGRPVSDEYEESIRSRAVKLGIDELVTLTGELNGLELQRQYERSDIFIFPTRQRSESFGIVLLEAMSFGLPLVGSGLGGVRSIIRDGVNGFYVPPEDPDRLAAALEVLIQDPGLRLRMGLAGIQLLQDEYSPAQFFCRMQEAFLSVGDRD